MSTHEPLFLQTFNPCPDRVEAIDKSLHDELDDKSLGELIDHMEKCRRCRRYRAYMEAVEKGFRDYEVASAEITPSLSADLPSALRVEMAQAMKRNLSKWMLEVSRNIMYRQGMFIRFFLGLSEVHDFDDSLQNTHNILTFLRSSGDLPADDRVTITESQYVLNKVDLSGDNRNFVADILKNCIHLHKYHMYPYLDLHQIFRKRSDFDASMKINADALKCDPDPVWKSVFINNIAGITQLKGFLAESTSLYKEALDNFKLPSVYLNLGMVFLEKGKLEESATNLESGVQLSCSYSSQQLRRKSKRYCSSFLDGHCLEHKDKIVTNERLKNLFESNRGIIK